MTTRTAVITILLCLCAVGAMEKQDNDRAESVAAMKWDKQIADHVYPGEIED